MKQFKWNEEKNIWLQETRGISFEEILEDIKNGQIIARTEHPDQLKYPRQKIFIINHNNYCYVVPFIEDTGDYFLKTIIPSRKATKKYLKDGGQYE
ncbi:MAG: toxin [Candidatus Aminicenantes bacterium]|nr:toxin [Candidatus Aminicenantes bacterium]